jgi:hypothetical protein
MLKLHVGHMTPRFGLNELLNYFLEDSPLSNEVSWIDIR